MATTVIQSETQQPIELKKPELAACLAWLIPGLGHFYQRRFAKAALYFVCIVGLFVHGLYLGSEGGSDGVGPARVVYFATSEQFPWIDRLPYVCQVGIGLPAMPALLQYVIVRAGDKPVLRGFMAPPSTPQRPIRTDEQDPRSLSVTAHELHLNLNRYFELGTVYTMVAGLLNVLAIYDAWGGPVFPERRKEDEDEKGKDKSKDKEKGKDKDAKDAGKEEKPA